MEIGGEGVGVVNEKQIKLKLEAPLPLSWRISNNLLQTEREIDRFHKRAKERERERERKRKEGLARDGSGVRKAIRGVNSSGVDLVYGVLKLRDD